MDVRDYERFTTSWGTVVDVRTCTHVRERTDGFTMSLQGSVDGEHWFALDTPDVHEAAWIGAFRATTGRESCATPNGPTADRPVKFVRGGPWRYGGFSWEVHRKGQGVQNNGSCPYRVCDGHLERTGGSGWERSLQDHDLYELEVRAPKGYTGPCPEGMWEETKEDYDPRCYVCGKSCTPGVDFYYPNKKWAHPACKHPPLKPGDRVRLKWEDVRPLRGNAGGCRECNGKTGVVKTSQDEHGNVRVLVEESLCSSTGHPCRWPAHLCTKIEERTCETCCHRRPAPSFCRYCEGDCQDFDRWQSKDKPAEKFKVGDRVKEHTYDKRTGTVVRAFSTFNAEVQWDRSRKEYVGCVLLRHLPASEDPLPRVPGVIVYEVTTEEYKKVYPKLGEGWNMRPTDRSRTGHSGGTEANVRAFFHTNAKPGETWIVCRGGNDPS